MKRFLSLIALLQLALGVRVIARLLQTAGGTRIATNSQERSDRVTVLVPVLNELGRLEPCLTGLVAQGFEVSEILVIDGGSTDGTQALVGKFTERDARVRLVEISPRPDENGKAQGLEAGLRAGKEAWFLTIDADVRPKPMLVRSLLAHAAQERIDVLSVATTQRLSSAAEGFLHPAMLSTLIYRFGIPGNATTRVNAVEANGQCFLVRRSLLDEVGGFASFTGALAEDVELARALAERGHWVGFYEADALVDVEMYANWRETWRNWSRSLPLRDRYSGVNGLIGIAEAACIQAAPLWLFPLALKQSGRNGFATSVNLALLITRLGVLNGSRRAYRTPPWTYWFSPLCDLPVAVQLMINYARRRYVWRGRAIVRGGFE